MSVPIDPRAVAQAQAAALPHEHIRLLVGIFESLADPTRARILYALLQHPLCVHDLALLVGVSDSAVSHQLRSLRDRRIVSSHRDGKIIRYALDDQHIAALFVAASDHIAHMRRGLADQPTATDEKP